MDRSRPGVLAITALAAVACVLIPVSGGASASGRLERDGITLDIPRGWSLIPGRINGVLDPVTVFTVSTFPVRARGTNGSSGVCSRQLRRAWRSAGAYIQLTEERDGASRKRMLRHVPPRPHHFVLDGTGWGGLCTPPNSGELSFRTHGRAFYVFYGIGRHAPKQLRVRAESLLDGMRITRR